MIKRWVDLLLVSGYKAYRGVREFVEEGEYNKKHLYVSRTGGKIEISLRNQVDVVEEVQAKIDDYSEEHGSGELIPYSLELALKGCHYITFSSGDKYVQFVTDNHKFELDFLINNFNKFQRFYYPVLGWLAENNFANKTWQVPSIPIYTTKPTLNTYEIVKGKKSAYILANFHKDIGLASSFTVYCLTKFMKIGDEKIDVRVG